MHGWLTAVAHELRPQILGYHTRTRLRTWLHAHCAGRMLSLAPSLSCSHASSLARSACSLAGAALRAFCTYSWPRSRLLRRIQRRRQAGLRHSTTTSTEAWCCRGMRCARDGCASRAVRGALLRRTGERRRGVSRCGTDRAREEPLSRLLICPRQVTGAHTLGRDQHK